MMPHSSLSENCYYPAFKNAKKLFSIFIHFFTYVLKESKNVLVIFAQVIEIGLLYNMANSYKIVIELA